MRPERTAQWTSHSVVKQLEQSLTKFWGFLIQSQNVITHLFNKYLSAGSVLDTVLRMPVISVQQSWFCTLEQWFSTWRGGGVQRVFAPPPPGLLAVSEDIQGMPLLSAQHGPHKDQPGTRSPPRRLTSTVCSPFLTAQPMFLPFSPISTTIGALKYLKFTT